MSWHEGRRIGVCSKAAGVEPVGRLLDHVLGRRCLGMLRRVDEVTVFKKM